MSIARAQPQRLWAGLDARLEGEVESLADAHLGARLQRGLVAISEVLCDRRFTFLQIQVCTRMPRCLFLSRSARSPSGPT